MTQNDIKNEQVKAHSFLGAMYRDAYFPDFLVDKCKAVLVELCIQIEQAQPTELSDLYVLTHAATDKFNDLQEDFWDNESEIETGARETIGDNFDFIAKAYGYEADREDLIATRDW